MKTDFVNLIHLRGNVMSDLKNISFSFVEGWRMSYM